MCWLCLSLSKKQRFRNGRCRFRHSAPAPSMAWLGMRPVCVYICVYICVCVRMVVCGCLSVIYVRCHVMSSVLRNERRRTVCVAREQIAKFFMPFLGTPERTHTYRQRAFYRNRQAAHLHLALTFTSPATPSALLSPHSPSHTHTFLLFHHMLHTPTEKHTLH